MLHFSKEYIRITIGEDPYNAAFLQGIQTLGPSFQNIAVLYLNQVQ